MSFADLAVPMSIAATPPLQLVPMPGLGACVACIRQNAVVVLSYSVMVSLIAVQPVAAVAALVVLLSHSIELPLALGSGSVVLLSFSRLVSSYSQWQKLSAKLFGSNVGSSSCVKHPTLLVPTGIEYRLFSCLWIS